MRLMHVSDKEWSDLRHTLEAGSGPAGAFMVLGPSEEIAGQAQALLEATSSQGHHVRYFLSSGGGVFRVPCFDSVVGSSMVPEPIDAYHLLAGRLNSKVPTSQDAVSNAVSELERAMIGESRVPRLVLIEHLTVPAKDDLSFSLLVLRTALPHRIPVVFFVHEPDVSDSSRGQHRHVADELLCMLYLCGGRVRAAEWYSMTEHLPAPGLFDQLVATRRIGSDVWFCYANCAIAEMAESAFGEMNQESRRKLASRALQALPTGTGYPLLAIASETGDLGTMLSRYSWGVVTAALLKPEGVVRYFDRLRGIAEAMGDPSLIGIATINYLASLLYVDRANAMQIYKSLRGVPPSNIDKRAEAVLWFVLGQGLALMELAEAWECAADCFRLSRECLCYVSEVSREAIQLSLASIANGEALLAYKQQEAEKARRLEELALTEMKDVDSHLYFQMHVKTNLGDVLLRLFSDIEGAIAQYAGALLMSTQVRWRLKRRLAPKKADRFELRAAQKLGNALLQAERYEEAIQVFEAVLARLERASGRNEKEAVAALKARLALAQAYSKVGRDRSAAVCYWHILRRPEWLGPDALRDVVSKLRCYRPEIHERLRSRMERIVSMQEETMVGVTNAQRVLTSSMA